MELRKRHAIMEKKLENAQKEKSESIKQLKQLFVIFTKQKKALELSIKKNKKFELDRESMQRNVKDSEQQNQKLRLKIDELEQ